MPNRDMFEPSRRVLHTLNALGRELLSNSDTEDMARKIVTAGIALLPLSVCCLWRRDAARSPDTLRLVMVRERIVEGHSPVVCAWPEVSVAVPWKLVVARW